MINIFKMKNFRYFSKLCSVGTLALIAFTSSSYAADNIAPFADALATPTTGIAPLEVTLEGNASHDEDGIIVDYQWVASDGQTVEGAEATLTFESEGDYEINLIVTDDLGAVNTSETVLIQVTSSEISEAPVASFTATPILAEVPLTVEVDASESIDSNGEIVDYQWTTSDGQTASGVTTSFTFESVGEYDISLIVEDNDGLMSDSVTTTVSAVETLVTTGNVDIGFDSLKETYFIGEPLAITVIETSVGVIRADNVDLWVAVEMSGVLLFITPESAFSTDAVPFKTGITPSETVHTAFEIDKLPPGLEGEYTVHATYVQEGGNLLTHVVSRTEQDVVIEGVESEITFDMRNVYDVGETLSIIVAETSTIPRAENVDLWVAVKMPTGEFLFMTSLIEGLLTSQPMPFVMGITPSETVYPVFEFVVPTTLKGQYTLFAVYMKQGINPLVDPDMQMSNLVVFPVELR
jgi:PKD repeat protein